MKTLLNTHNQGLSKIYSSPSGRTKTACRHNTGGFFMQSRPKAVFILVFFLASSCASTGVYVDFGHGSYKGYTKEIAKDPIKKWKFIADHRFEKLARLDSLNKARYNSKVHRYWTLAYVVSSGLVFMRHAEATSIPMLFRPKVIK